MTVIHYDIEKYDIAEIAAMNQNILKALPEGEEAIALPDGISLMSLDKETIIEIIKVAANGLGYELVKKMPERRRI